MSLHLQLAREVDEQTLLFLGDDHVLVSIVSFTLGEAETVIDIGEWVTEDTHQLNTTGYPVEETPVSGLITLFEVPVHRVSPIPHQLHARDGMEYVHDVASVVICLILFLI